MTPDISSNQDAERLALKNAGQILMSQLVENFPGFDKTWAAYLADWGQESPGAFVDIGEFARFFAKELFPMHQDEKLSRALSSLDELFLRGDEAMRDLIGIGFIEDLQKYP